MIYWYELTVERDGVHVLTTNRSVGGSVEQADATLSMLTNIYPKSMGYTVMLRRVTGDPPNVDSGNWTFHQVPAIPPLGYAVARYYESVSRPAEFHPLVPRVISVRV